jgi:hypothetical protein
LGSYGSVTAATTVVRGMLKLAGINAFGTAVSVTRTEFASIAVASATVKGGVPNVKTPLIN